MNMKTLRTLGMAFTAILMTMGFAACSDDDNEGGQPGTPGTSGKQLVMWHESNDDYVDLHYGDDGWLARAYSSEGSDRDVIYIHENDGGKYTTITAYDADEMDDRPRCEFTFDNLLRRVDGEPCEYDAEGHMTSCGGYTFVWEDGNLVRVIAPDGYRYDFTYYTDLENKSPIDSDPLIYFIEDYFTIAHPQLLGTWSKNLVKTMTEHDEPTTTWKYTLDSDGYVTKAVEMQYDDSDDYYLEYEWK